MNILLESGSTVSLISVYVYVCACVCACARVCVNLTCASTLFRVLQGAKLTDDYETFIDALFGAS
jgi:hypothetical protein